MSKYNFYYYNELINKLKEIRRTGWIKSHISDPETVAEHIFHVSVISLYLASSISHSVDITKVLILSLIHDLPESIYGDIPTPQKSVEDVINEKSWLKKFLLDIGYSEKWADDLFELRDLESKIVKISDLVATLIQGLEYSEKYGCKNYLKEIIENNIQESKKILNLIEDSKFEKYVTDLMYSIENKYKSLCKG